VLAVSAAPRIAKLFALRKTTTDNCTSRHDVTTEQFADLRTIKFQQRKLKTREMKESDNNEWNIGVDWGEKGIQFIARR
jgi:hypothetical protein